MSELVKRLRSAEDSVGLTLYEEAADALEAQAKRITELEARQQSDAAMIDLLKQQHAIDREQLADSNEALQVLGLKLAHAEGHSASTVGPTPGAAPACEQPLNDNAQKEAS